MEAVVKPLSLKVWPRSSKTWLPILALILGALLFHWLTSWAFLTPRNLSNLSRQICVNLTLAVGMTMVILTAGIDLSVGSVLALSGMAAAITQVQWGWSDWGTMGALLSFFVAVGVGAGSGAINGILISRFQITPFIATLGMMVICRGLTLIISGAQAVAPLGEDLSALSSNYLPPTASLILLGLIPLLVALAGNFSRAIAALLASAIGVYVFYGYRGIPYMVFLAVLCTIAGIYLLKYTRFGRFLYAIGGNREAAVLSGVPVPRALWTTYFMMGCLAGLAGVLDSARVNGAVPSAGELAELDAIAAVVIGGTSLMGGVGAIGNTVLGVLVMGILNNGMSLMGVSEHYQKVFKGLVIILAVYLDRRSKRRS